MRTNPNKNRPKKEKALFIAHEIGWTPEKDIENIKLEAKIEVLEEVLFAFEEYLRAPDNIEMFYDYLSLMKLNLKKKN